MTDNNLTPDDKRRFTLPEMSELMMRAERPPFGFIVSEAVWKGLTARWQEETNDPLAVPPAELRGVQIVVDPAMPDTEFEVAFTQEAWTTRLKSLTPVSHRTRARARDGWGRGA